MGRTILLVQVNSDVKSRTYFNYSSAYDCFEGVCKWYEDHLRHLYPNQLTYTYTIDDLFNFMDEMCNVSCLVYYWSTKSYAMFNRKWVKDGIYIHLRGQAKPQQGE